VKCGATKALICLWLTTLVACDRDVLLGEQAAATDAGIQTKNDAAELADAALPLELGMPWSSGFEDATLGEWKTAFLLHKGRYYTSPAAQLAVSRERAHSGSSSLKITLQTDGGALRIAKLLREGTLVDELTFSAWFLLPEKYRIDDYLNLLQLRGRTNSNGNGEDVSLWDVNLRTRNDRLEWFVYDHSKQKEAPLAVPISPAVPINTWFQLTIQIRQATGPDGRIRVLQGDTLMLDLKGVPTVPSRFLQCNVGGLSPDMVPSPGIIFVDDVALTTP
jgi:hypothetical protein